MIGVGIGIPFFRSFGGGIDAQAQAHFNRVIADGGVVPSGLTGVNAFFSAVKAIYGTSDINTAISAAYDPHYLGYRLGAGSGTTLGQAARTLYSCSGASGDVVQTTAASQPLLLAHTGTNYYFNSNAVGNNVTTPLKISNGYNGEFEIQAWIEPTIFASGTVQDYPVIFTAGGNFSLGIILNGNSSTLRSLNCPINGGSGVPTTNTINVSTFKGWIKVYRTATNLRWETSTDGVNWTLFENVTITNTAFTLTGNSVIGNYNNSDARAQYSGRINRVLVWINGSSSTGTLTYDFNPSSYNPATSQTQWTSATGEVWSINVGTAASGYKGVLVDRTITQGDGIDDRLLTPNVNLTATDKISVFSGIKRLGLQLSIIYDLGLVANRAGLAITSLGAYQGFSINSGLVNEYQTPSNSTLLAFTQTVDRNLAAIDEQQIYYNNVLQVKTPVNAGNTSGNFSNGPIAMFSRTDAVAPCNLIINSLVVAVGISDTAQRTAMYNAIRGFNNNAF